MIFTYTENDFVYDTLQGDYLQQSSFDQLLHTKWLSAVDKGCFRYILNILDTKRIPGKYSFLAQLNPDRATKRRPPENIRSLTQPFDDAKFNFTKIGEDEILFEIKGRDIPGNSQKSSGKDLLTINVSPHEFGHSLFLPEVSSCLPQILTLYCIQRTIELMLLSKSPALRAGFNSLCAFATVNHLHFHLYYLKYDMMLEKIGVEHLVGECYVLTQYPSVGFAFQLNRDHNVLALASSVHKLTSYLQEHNIAHNVYMTRGYSFGSDCDDNATLDTIRVYVWARKHCLGLKNIHGFDPAICELFGHLIVKVVEPYASLTEDQVAKELNDVCQETFDQVLQDVQMLFNES